MRFGKEIFLVLYELNDEYAHLVRTKEYAFILHVNTLFKLYLCTAEPVQKEF